MAPMPKRACVLVSGGLDSDVLLWETSRSYSRVYPVYVQQNLAWESTELYWLKRFLKRLPGRTIQPLVVLSNPMNDVYGKHWSTGHGAVPGARSADKTVYLPGRNLVLALKAAIFALSKDAHTLALGSLGHNPFPDATPSFFREWSRVLSKGLAFDITVQAPYRTLGKAAVIKRGMDLPLHLSFSCISPKGRRHCGHCNKCAERKRAFREANIEDRTHYA